MITTFLVLLAMVVPLQQQSGIQTIMLDVLGDRTVSVEELGKAGLIEKETITIQGRLEDAPFRSLRITWQWTTDEQGQTVRVPVEVNDNPMRTPENSSSPLTRQSYVAPADIYFLYAADYSEGSFYLTGRVNEGSAQRATVEFYPNDHFHQVNVISSGTTGDTAQRYEYDLRKAVFTVDFARRQIVELRLLFNTLTFTEVNELNILPSFISDRLDYYRFDEVTVHTKLQKSEDGIWLPAETLASASKLRKEYIIQVSLNKTYLPRPQEMADTGNNRK